MTFRVTRSGLARRAGLVLQCGMTDLPAPSTDAATPPPAVDVPAGPRLVLTLLAALAAWEVGEVVSSWLVVEVLAPGVPLAFGAGPGLQQGTLVALLLRVAVVLAVAAPVALLPLRPVLGSRER